MLKLMIGKGLLGENIQGYDEEQLLKKKAFHRDGKKFLTSLATVLGLNPNAYEIRSNTAGPAVSGEVTLHADHLYVQLGEFSTRRGVSILYRSCKDRKDYTGGHNNFGFCAELKDSATQERFLKHCARLMADAA